MESSVGTELKRSNRRSGSSNLLCIHGSSYLTVRLATQPRTYPAQFAAAIAGTYDDMKASACGCPALPATLVPAVDLFREHPTPQEVSELFQLADLESVYVYLRGCQKLRIPDPWRELFPVMVPSSLEGLETLATES